ncbi:MAG: YceG family protein [Lachnospiraceae bacterium]|nr:YceG family protein [Lachnospiraceae bacterium]
MFEHKKIQNLEDFFVEMNNRQSPGVYFYRINQYNDDIKNFIMKYYDKARMTGVVIEGRIPNPDEKNLAYYQEIMGMDFQMNENFISTRMKKWLPRMNDYQNKTISASIFQLLSDMQKKGKNENMLKNAYIKFMCWMYYKFERIISKLGENEVPKILYEGDISKYELDLVTILCNAGCDVVLLQYNGDTAYLQHDPKSELSEVLTLPGMTKFPNGFCLKQLREQIANRQKIARLYGREPKWNNCTNAWFDGKGLEDFKREIALRGNDERFYYNCFCRINGVEDKVTYQNELFQFYNEIKNNNRRIVIVDERIPVPEMNEINSIQRGNYNTIEQLIMDLLKNINYITDMELKCIVHKAFVDVLMEEASGQGMNLNKLKNKAVYLLCWFKRYYHNLLANWKMPEISCFIYMGGCKDDNESLFVKFLSKLPVDVLILNPNLNNKCVLEDKMLFELNYNESLPITGFPRENAEIRIGTAAFHAERELDSALYQGSGIYRDMQHDKAVSISLQTMYEEIDILWDQEVKYRPNFSVTDDVVNIPVICAKVCGVKDGNVDEYFGSIRKLVTDDTFVIRNAPYIEQNTNNPLKGYATEFYKNNKLQRQVIKNHPKYPYSFLKEEVQEHMLEKLQILIDQKIIKGTFENGMEYNIVATVLNMDKEIVRMIQKFDFTKKNPKLIYINTKEAIISPEDSIIVAFLNLVGFDIVFFVPTGYQTIEKYFNRNIFQEHQIGEYIYDLDANRLDSISAKQKSWRNKIFKRGN